MGNIISMDKTLEELYDDLDLVDLELNTPRLQLNTENRLLLRRGQLIDLIENYGKEN